MKYYLIFVSLFLFSSVALSSPDSGLVKQYGQTPQYRGFSIAPDGRHIAFIYRGESNDILLVRDQALKKIIYKANITDIKARYTSFVSNHHVIVRASRTQDSPSYRGQFEYSSAIIIDFKNKKTYPAFKETKDIHPLQGGLGKIIGFEPVSNSLLMPAWDMDDRYNLYRIDLNTGSGELHTYGDESTIDWFVNRKGEVIGREQYDDKKKLH